jgi:molybdenum cofactor cytidylyltransferase
VLFDRQLFDEMLRVTGDEGARSVVRRHRAEMATVAIEDPELFADIDTPEDYDRLVGRVSS